MWYGDESAGDAKLVCRGNGEVKAYTNGNRHSEREKTTETHVGI
jgi:hypothetical protein